MGNVGVGKTTTMSVLARKYIMAGRRVEWISYPAFIMKLQSMFRKDNESPYDYASEIARFRGILMIDDLGAEKLSDFVRQVTYYIINEREQRMLKTIITTNFTLEQICDQIDPRISSRLVGMCEVVKLSGKDKRLSK
jgi:DNA replication protein DnaC